MQGRSTRLKTIQNKLIKASQSWALKQGFDAESTGEFRREALQINHADYVKNIPVYQRIALEEGCDKDANIPTIKSKLMSTDDIFKSYSPEWLDSRDFVKMNQWLSNLYYRPIRIDVKDINSIDDWLERLSLNGIKVSYSSGTSGTFSFVPRDEANWRLVKTANTGYITPLLAAWNIGSPVSRLILKPAAKVLSPGAFAKAVSKQGLNDFDGVFLGFRQGKMGNQVLMEELAPIFRRHYFLYNINLSASALRSLRRGAQTEGDEILLKQLQAAFTTNKERNYLKIIEHLKESTDEGQKVFIFGAPYQFKELCELSSGGGRRLGLKKGSLILFGGGWKSFAGETLDRGSLVTMISETFDLPPERVLEGYSMTEINALMVRCNAGRFHIPPFIEPVIFDEALSPLEGKNLKGTFGFLDSLAVSYPGFIISGDQVRLIDEECKCGISGPAISEIGRAQNREIKGCGGIMSSIRA